MVDIQALVVHHLIKAGDVREDTIDTKELHLPYIIQVTNFTLDVLSECQRSTISNELLTDTVSRTIQFFWH
jgi:hypothetical protein